MAVTRDLEKSRTSDIATDHVDSGQTEANKTSFWQHRLNPLKRSAIPPVPTHRGVSGEYRAGFFSALYFQWMVPLLSVGYQRPLELNDVWEVNPNRSVDMLASAFKASLQRHNARPGRLDPLLMAIYDTFRADFLVGGLCFLIAGCMQVLTPFVLKYLILYV